MRPKHRLFFAYRPPAPIAGTIGALRAGLALDRGEVANDRLHLTLGITGDYDAFPQSVAEAMRRIGDAAEGWPMRIVLDRLSGSPTSVALRPQRAIPGLRAFQR